MVFSFIGGSTPWNSICKSCQLCLFSYYKCFKAPICCRKVKDSPWIWTSTGTGWVSSFAHDLLFNIYVLSKHILNFVCRGLMGEWVLQNTAILVDLMQQGMQCCTLNRKSCKIFWCTPLNSYVLEVLFMHKLVQVSDTLNMQFHRAGLNLSFSHHFCDVMDILSLNLQNLYETI